MMMPTIIRRIENPTNFQGLDIASAKGLYIVVIFWYPVHCTQPV